jgi:hypothetical protein
MDIDTIFLNFLSVHLHSYIKQPNSCYMNWTANKKRTIKIKLSRMHTQKIVF